MADCAAVPDEELERTRIRLNQYFAGQITLAIEKNPAANFDQLVNGTLTVYRRHLQAATKRATKTSQEKGPTKPRKRCSPEFHEVPRGIPVIAAALSPLVLRLLSSPESPSSREPIALLQHGHPRLVEEGQYLFSGVLRYVIKLSDEVVVKIGRNLAHEEYALLEFVKHHAPGVPIPMPLGIAMIGEVSYMFSTFIPGETLENRWKTLSPCEKVSVRHQLQQMILELRGAPHLTSTPLGMLSSPFLCKNVRMFLSTSASTLSSVSEFHDFLLEDPLPRISSGYLRWLRSLLRDDYRNVMTHGDFHPQNILVADDVSNGGIIVSGIIDWEMGGWYPEYWEMYKALNTRAADNDSDWWDSFPEAILGCDLEVAVGRLVERVTHG
ncbi:kinase-like protein [Rickenella mellea]|uniref:Kinase-like protein n=1 Tax=Rickenella mellea TaxID=50990 RepID=A0A4Y7PRL8_9AGAM|nr:kinase-like protein [Rickenella mellea]